MQRNKLNYIIIIFWTVAIIGLLCYLQNYLFNRQTPKVVETQFDYEILYTDQGYKPDILEIPINSKVAFKNTTNTPMWTASDPHPVHSDFSAFDARKDYMTGETYIFEFSSAGTFGFHNHEKSIDRGIIRVIDPKNPAPNIDKTKQNQRVQRDTLMAMFDQKNPESIFTVIDTIEANNTLSRDCHDMSHDLGHKAYELFGFSTAMTFNNPNRLSHTSVDDICAGGYMHGILEELFLHQPELKNNPGNICSSIPDINRGSCFHGVGHGLMFVNKRNIPDSLTSCRNLGNPTDTSRCFEGVWMEMFWGDTQHAGSNSLGWTLEKPLTPCANAKQDEKPACFLYAHLGYLRTHHKDFTGALSLCTNSNLNQSDTHFCIKGIGITMMKHFTSHHLEESEKLVENLDSEKKFAYYQGVIGYARLSAVPERDLNTFCSLLKTDQQICLDVLKTNN